MCFSPEASFASGAVLTALGTYAVVKSKSRPDRALAIVPLVFAFQQILEGAIWVSLPAMQIRATFLSIPFLFFALFWWQFYMPLVAMLHEKNHLKKKLFFVLTIVGLLSGAALFGYGFASLLAPMIVGESIHYNFTAPFPKVFIGLYGATTFGAAIFSSDKFLRTFGMLLLLFALIAAVFYEVNYASVWCFFGAILSIILCGKFFVRKI